MQQVRATALLYAIASGWHVPSRMGPAAIKATTLHPDIMSCQCWAGQVVSGLTCNVYMDLHLTLSFEWDSCGRSAAWKQQGEHAGCTALAHSNVIPSLTQS